MEKLVYGGDGLARLPADEHGRGKAVFVPFVLAGERVEAELLEHKPGFARARLEKVLQPAPQRAEPRCPYFQRCGGCQYQHANYDHQLAIKAEILKENLRRIAKAELSCKLTIHPSPPWHYRNRTRLQVHTEPAFALGYFRFNSHELLPVEECPISSPLISRAITATWKLGRAGQMPQGITDIEFFANAADTQLLVEVSCAGVPLPELKSWAEAFPREFPELRGVAVVSGPSPDNPPVQIEKVGLRPRAKPHSKQQEQQAPVAVLRPAELIYGTQRASYRVSPGSFFQVNRYLIDDLVSIVAHERSGRLALDLYAGVGLFSAVLAGQFDHIMAVESSQSSFADLRYNLPANGKAVRATVEHYLAARAGKLRPDLIVVDPPRSGLDERVTRDLARLGSPRITYVSCDPATLARDLKVLIAAGYRIEQAYLVDLFPQTYHLESVLQLVR